MSDLEFTPLTRREPTQRREAWPFLYSVVDGRGIVKNVPPVPLPAPPPEPQENYRRPARHQPASWPEDLFRKDYW